MVATKKKRRWGGGGGGRFGWVNVCMARGRVTTYCSYRCALHRFVAGTSLVELYVYDIWA